MNAMFGKRCQLCGGKLDHNVCTLCGLDNSKSDMNYKLNQSSCDGKELTHVHEENSKQKQRQSRPQVQKSAGKKANGKNGSVVGKVIAIITIVGILFNMLQIGFESFDIFDDFGSGRMERELYSNVTRELSEEGELWSQNCQQGEYVVGVHIPEGTYRVEFRGEATSFNLEDNENSIYFWEDSFDYEGKGLKEIEDIRCYSGARIKINSSFWGGLTFYSENAQVDEMIGLENPLTEMVVVKNGNVAGVDFPAGMYDIEMQEGESLFEYIVPGTVIDDPEDDYVDTTNSIGISTYDDEFVYRNIYLPEGTELLIEGDDVTLVPSEMVLPSYEDYYYIYE